MSNAPPLALSDLMAKTGFFLSYWSLFEIELCTAITAAREQLGDHRRKMPDGLNTRLDLWLKLVRRLPDAATLDPIVRAMRDDARRLRNVRNIIVHGLALGNAQPEDGGPGYIKCLEGGYQKPTGKDVRYTMADLEHFVQSADALRRGCKMGPSFFNYRLPAKYPK
ncbi:hypothetical protein [Vitreimonas flagellata]|uniref:hypothetical protein n=1 Tax=Vitreimonas flagellata TaxID=2560861 RepID=UPI001074AFF9|nr:hypothetical protein [Vitreimonas flagellata]